MKKCKKTVRNETARQGQGVETPEGFNKYCVDTTDVEG